MSEAEHTGRIFIMEMRRIGFVASSIILLIILLLSINLYIVWRDWRESESDMNLSISRQLFDDLITVIDDFSRSESGISLEVERFADSSVVIDREHHLSDIYIMAREEMDPAVEESLRRMGLAVETIGWLGTTLAVNFLNPAEMLDPDALRGAFRGRPITWGELAGLARKSREEPVTVVTSRRIWRLKGWKVTGILDEDGASEPLCPDRVLVFESDSDVIHYVKNNRYALGLLPTGAIKPGLKPVYAETEGEDTEIGMADSNVEAKEAYAGNSTIDSGYNLVMIYKKRPIICNLLSRLCRNEWSRDKLKEHMTRSLNHGIEAAGEQSRDPGRRRDKELGLGIKIAAVGDIMLDRKIGKRIKERGPDYPFRSTRDIMSSAAVAFGNLETPISDQGRQINMFRARPETVLGLTYAGFDILSLANNHILDYDNPALSQTIEILRRNKIAHIGAGMNIEEARRPALYEAGGVRIAFLAYSELWFCYSRTGRPWAASHTQAGVAPAEERIIREDIEKARKLADIVIVSFHWGREYENYPTDNMRKMARVAVESGAEIILGHHPHVLQGIEFYNNGIIIYSLGNFVFDLIRESTRSSAIALIGLRDKEVVSIELIPIYLIDGEPVVVVNEERERILDDLWTYSLPLNRNLNRRSRLADGLATLSI